MKILLTALVLVEIFLLMLLTVPVLVDRHERARAVVEASEHPSDEAKARAATLVAKDQHEALLSRFMVLACVIGNGILIYSVAQKIRGQPNRIRSRQPTR